MKKTISVVVGKGSITHNNRDFFTENIDQSRTKDNMVFIKQSLKEAYKELFDEAIENYNVGKKPSRQKSDYMKEIENSGNGEKVFQEIVVQIGDKDNTKIGSKDWETAKEILIQYAKDFQEKNENVHVFNSVLHLDESTPHLHISFIPVATGYKTGLQKRNSFSKSMNDRFNSKEGVGAWFKHERIVLSEMATARGIEIEVLGDDRQHLALKDYKETKDKIKELQQEKIEIEENVNELAENLAHQYNQKKSELTGELKTITQDIQIAKNELANTKSLVELKNENSNLIQTNQVLKNELGEKNLIIENQKQVITQQQAEISKKDKTIAKLERTVNVAKEFIREKASWLGNKFNDFFRNKAKVENIETLVIDEQPRTKATIKSEIQDVSETLTDLQSEELDLILSENDDLKPVLEPKQSFEHKSMFEPSKSLEVALNAQKLQSDDADQDEWVQVNNNFDCFVEVKENEYIPVTEKPSLLSQLKKEQNKVDEQKRKQPQRDYDLDL